METMSILAPSNTLKLCYDLKNESITANRAVLKERQDYGERLSEAFKKLISIVHAEEAEARSIDSLVESSLYQSTSLLFTLTRLMP